MERLIEMGERMGLSGEALQAFVTEQQSIEREERQRERDLKRLQVEVDAREADRKHELEMKKVERESAAEVEITTERGVGSGKRPSRFPKLPPFQESSDEIDSYLQRFERFAKSNGWPDSEWATALSALLTGKALDVYSRMPDDAALNFALLKEALLKCYDLMTDGYRNKFRKCRSELYENPEQFITWLNTYLDKWILLSHTADTPDGIKDLFIREQFINACPRDLAAHLREREIPNLMELAQVAERFLTARNRKFYSVPTTHQSNPSLASGEANCAQPKEASLENPSVLCYLCKKFGHKASECKFRPRRVCYICGKLGHEARDCWSHQRGTAGDAKSKQKAATAIRKHQHEQGVQQEVRTRESEDVGAGCLSSRDQLQFASAPNLSHCNPRGYLMMDSRESSFRQQRQNTEAD